MNKIRILYSLPSRSHVEIAADEITGLQELGYTCLSFPYSGKDGFRSKIGRIWVIIQNAFNLIKIAHTYVPDIIYLNSRFEEVGSTRDFITIVIFKIFYYKKVHFVIKSHGSDIYVLESNKFLIRKIILPFLRKNISGWFFLSTEERDKILEYGYFSADKIFVTKNIVRAWQFKRDDQFRFKLNIPEYNKILLFVGRIIKKKGIYEVIDSFKNLVNSHKAVLIVVGDGTEYQNVKQLVNKSGLTDKVIFTGFISERDVVEFYANCDVLIFPTFDTEGFPMALFNSVAAGLSIITTPIRAATDYLSEPENCLWVERENSDSVYNALINLLNSDTLIAEMRVNNLNKARLFDKKTVSAELSEMIQTIIKN